MSDRTQTHRRVVSYIDKSREYYAAHGYGQPYQWASYDDVPFVKWSDNGRDLSSAKVGVVTTTFPAVFTAPKKVYAHPSSPTPDAMFTKDLSWDKDATHTNDVGTFLPLDALNSLADDGVIGSVSERFYGVPTEYSQSRTHADAQEIVAWAKQDGVDAMILVPL
ncbi:MAG: D-proline reductase (dithiol) PrdB [Acidimicrobiales bacterium]|jgi:D-proline reductase (dithiol) PrdB